MGSPDFAIPSLEKLHSSAHEVVSVVSNVDKRRGRGSQTSPTPVKARALELGLPVIEVEDLKSETFTRQLEACKADLFVVVAFRILPQKILDIPQVGSVNLHASLLPRYRGAAPIHWAVISGEKKTGCTVFFLEQQVDAGQILSQVETAIGPNETTGDVYERLKMMGADLLLEAVEDIASGDYETVAQHDEAASPAPKLFSKDCRLDFSKTASAVHNKIRGLSPFPTAWARWGDKRVNIYRSAVGPELDLEPGRLRYIEGRLLAGCSDGTVELLELQLPGKKRMSGEAFYNGHGDDIQLQ